jgi:mono/diheme cytochrome c family protein
MKKPVMLFLLAVAMTGCTRHDQAPVLPAATAKGAALVEVSGSKQVQRIGAALDQPVVLQVNDAQGAAVKGALVKLSGTSGTAFEPGAALTDDSGQFTALVSAPGQAGHFEVVASTQGSDGKTVEIKLDEMALGYEQLLGRQLNQQFCNRCHDPESTTERVSNMDNLDPKPHPFSEGDTLNKMSDADLVAIIGHGGGALSKSPSMPPFGYTLSKSDIQALVGYIRAVADPPYHAPGATYANK